MDAKIHGIDGIPTMKLLQPHRVHPNHLKYQMSLYHAICVFTHLEHEHEYDAANEKEKKEERTNKAININRSLLACKEYFYCYCLLSSSP